MILAWTLTLSTSLLIFVIHNSSLKLITKQSRKLRMFTVMFILALLHIVEIGVYAAAIYAGVEFFQLGAISGASNEGFLEYFYFSATNYTSLGYGDLIAAGRIRLLAIFEALIGLLAIGWSTAFAFWWMEQNWLGECMSSDKKESGD